MCKVCKIAKFFHCNYCPNCGYDLLNGVINYKTKTFKLNGVWYEYSDDPIMYGDWFISIDSKNIDRLRHHSYSQTQWDAFDKTNLKKLVKTTSTVFPTNLINKNNG